MQTIVERTQFRFENTKMHRKLRRSPEIDKKKRPNKSLLASDFQLEIFESIVTYDEIFFEPAAISLNKHNEVTYTVYSRNFGNRYAFFKRV